MTYFQRRAPIEIDPALLTPRDLRAWRMSMWAPRRKEPAPRETSTGPQQDAHVLAHIASRFAAYDESGVPVTPRMSTIIRAVSGYYGVPVLDIKSARRTADVMRPRLVCYYLGRHLTALSLPQVGMHLGGRDHTSILSGVRKIMRLLDAGDELLRAELEAICASLGVTFDERAA